MVDIQLLYWILMMLNARRVYIMITGFLKQLMLIDFLSTQEVRLEHFIDS